MNTIHGAMARAVDAATFRLAEANLASRVARETEVAVSERAPGASRDAFVSPARPRLADVLSKLQLTDVALAKGDAEIRRPRLTVQELGVLVQSGLSTRSVVNRDLAGSPFRVSGTLHAEVTSHPTELSKWLPGLAPERQEVRVSLRGQDDDGQIVHLQTSSQYSLAERLARLSGKKVTVDARLLPGENGSAFSIEAITSSNGDFVRFREQAKRGEAPLPSSIEKLLDDPARREYARAVASLYRAPINSLSPMTSELASKALERASQARDLFPVLEAGLTTGTSFESFDVRRAVQQIADRFIHDSEGALGMLGAYVDKKLVDKPIMTGPVDAFFGGVERKTYHEAFNSTAIATFKHFKSVDELLALIDVGVRYDRVTNGQTGRGVAYDAAIKAIGAVASPEEAARLAPVLKRYFSGSDTMIPKIERLERLARGQAGV